MNKVHSPINWENYPSEKTPINEENLNKMDNAIGVIDDRVVEHENKKATKEEVASVISDVEYNVNNSVFKFTRKNGDAITVDIANVSAKEAYTREESDKKYVSKEIYSEDIERLTNDKINYSDIVDNFDSNATNLPVSANMARVLNTSKASVGGNDFTPNTLKEIFAWLAEQPGRFYAGRTKLPASLSPNGQVDWFRCIFECQSVNIADGGINVIAMLDKNIWHGYSEKVASGTYELKWDKLANQNDIGHKIVTLSDSSYKFTSDSEQSLFFNGIKNARMLIVKVGIYNTGGGEVSATNGHFVRTLVFTNFSEIGRAIDTTGFYIHSNDEYNGSGGVSVNFDTGEIRYRMGQLKGWTSDKFGIMRIYAIY